MDSDESWELASLEEFTLKKHEKKQKQSVRTVRLRTLHKMLLVIESMRRMRAFPVMDGANEYEKLAYFTGCILKNGTSESAHGPKRAFNGFYNSPDMRPCNASPLESGFAFDKEVLFFIALNTHNIPCRIYFVIDSTIQIFHEYLMNKKVVEHTTKYNGNCFSIDFHGFVKDQTVAFSKNCSHHRVFRRILEAIQSRTNSFPGHVPSSTGGNIPVKEFEEIDERRIATIPTNINKIKIHPLYITEDMCNSTQFIYPKRPVLGLIRGVPVYPRKNLAKLRTEKGWYREGREIKSQPAKPYRIVQERRLFAEFQTRPVELEDITGKLMDAFHPNLTPRNSIYIDYDSGICRDLGVGYSDCLVGFRGKEMVIRGFFVNKKDCFLVNYFIKEREYYGNVSQTVEKYERALSEWKRLIAKARKLLAIRKRVGI